MLRLFCCFLASFCLFVIILFTTGRMYTAHAPLPLYVSFIGGDFEVFASKGQHVAPVRVKYGCMNQPKVDSFTPNFTLIGAEVWCPCGTPELKILPILKYERPAGACPLRSFVTFSDKVTHCGWLTVKIRGITSRGSGVSRALP